MPRKRARPVREGVVGKGAPTQSHLAGDLLHVTYGSERAGGRSSLPLLARQYRASCGRRRFVVWAPRAEYRLTGPTALI
jgi:hypothetical protein